MTTVAELIAFLKKQPKDLIVVHGMYSEQLILDLNKINIKEHCLPRTDGWVQNKRPDMPSQPYLVLPGN